MWTFLIDINYAGDTLEVIRCDGVSYDIPLDSMSCRDYFMIAYKHGGNHYYITDNGNIYSRLRKYLDD